MCLIVFFLYLGTLWILISCISADSPLAISLTRTEHNFRFGLPVVLSRVESRIRAVSPIFDNALEFTVFSDYIMDPFGKEIHREKLRRNGTSLTAFRQRQQTIDLLRIWRHLIDGQCFGHKMLLWMEDDFILCDDADVDLYYVVNWAKDHWDAWDAIRIGFGLSGLLLKCDTVRSLVLALPDCQQAGIDYVVSQVLRDQKFSYRVYRCGIVYNHFVVQRTQSNHSKSRVSVFYNSLTILHATYGTRRATTDDFQKLQSARTENSPRIQLSFCSRWTRRTLLI